MSRTDKELFREYLNSKVEGIGDMVAAHYFAPDNHEFYNLDGVLRDMANAILFHDPEPLPELDFALQEFRGVVANLERVKAGFVAFRASRIAEPSSERHEVA